MIGGIYRVFISQTKAYTVQDQVAEIQQDVRGAMEIMVRDIRMAGFQTNTSVQPRSVIARLFPIIVISITVNYEYIPSVGCPRNKHSDLCASRNNLTRTSTAFKRQLLDNVTCLNFSYGIDADGDGIIDGIDPVSGVIPDGAFVQAAGVGQRRFLLSALL